MADRNRELVPDKWSLVRERSLNTGLFVRKDGILMGVCRRAELPGRSVKPVLNLVNICFNKFETN